MNVRTLKKHREPIAGCPQPDGRELPAHKGRECAMCHQHKGWWEFSGRREVCLDCQAETEPQGLDSLWTRSRKAA
jgi:hypothetical protein